MTQTWHLFTWRTSKDLPAKYFHHFPYNIQKARSPKHQHINFIIYSTWLQLKSHNTKVAYPDIILFYDNLSLLSPLKCGAWLFFSYMNDSLMSQSQEFCVKYIFFNLFFFEPVWPLKLMEKRDNFITRIQLKILKHDT